MVSKGLSGNQLKLLAMLFMTLDHIGCLLFPQALWLRMVGRLAFPIYAFLIAEGCRHTRSMGKYLLSMAAVAALCQVVELFRGSFYQCILVTFSLSLIIIWLWEKAKKEQTLLSRCFVVLGILVSFFLCEILPLLLPGTDFMIDYNFFGVMTPVFVFLGKDRKSRLLGLTAGLCCIAAGSVSYQWLSLLAIPLLFLYNGARGKGNLKWLFYFYYPAHLAAIYLVWQMFF